MTEQKEFKFTLRERIFNRLGLNEGGYVVKTSGGEMLTFGKEALKYKIVRRSTLEKWLEERRHDHS